MRKPVARGGLDHFSCTSPDAPTAVIPPAGAPVKALGAPVAVMGDPLPCTRSGNMIAEGSSTVRIRGLPVARKTDKTVHKGAITTGDERCKLGGGTLNLKTFDDPLNLLGKKSFWFRILPNPVNADKDGNYDLGQLSGFSQVDYDSETKSDDRRCAANSATFQLVAGGSAKLDSGVSAAEERAFEQIMAEQQKKPADERRLERLEEAITTFEDTKLDVKRNELTKGQLNKTADALFATYESQSVPPKKPNYDRYGNVTKPYQSGQHGMMADNESQMLKDMGLANDATAEAGKTYNVNHSADLDDQKAVDEAQRKAAREALEGVKKSGKTAQLGVSTGGSMGPVNHAVVAGWKKDANGNDIPYVYDPATGKVHEGKEAEEYLAVSAPFDVKDNTVRYGAPPATYQP